ncbi:MAG TPA: kelch repeat-containing protein [Solirubrobacterales bacterium]
MQGHSLHTIRPTRFTSRFTPVDAQRNKGSRRPRRRNDDRLRRRRPRRGERRQPPRQLADDARLPGGDPEPGLPRRHLPQRPGLAPGPGGRLAPRTGNAAQPDRGQRDRHRRDDLRRRRLAPGNLHRVVAYDTGTKKFSDPTQLPTGLNHVQAATRDGKLYLAGGYLDGEDPTGNFWEYDPATKEWAKLAPLPQPTAGGAVVAIGGKLYVAGGAPQTFGATAPVAPYPELQIYDFESGEWSLGPEMPSPRHHVGGASLGGDLYVAGGRGEADHSLDTFERYDPATGRWKSLPPLPLGVASPGLVAADGKLVVVGGEDQDEWEDGKGWVTPSAWEFDPRTNRWSRLPNMEYERRGGGVAAVGDTVYAIGGSYCPGLKPGGPVGTHTVESLNIARARTS